MLTDGAIVEKHPHTHGDQALCSVYSVYMCIHTPDITSYMLVFISLYTLVHSGYRLQLYQVATLYLNATAPTWPPSVPNDKNLVIGFGCGTPQSHRINIMADAMFLDEYVCFKLEILMTDNQCDMKECEKLNDLLARERRYADLYMRLVKGCQEEVRRFSDSSEQSIAKAAINTALLNLNTLHAELRKYRRAEAYIREMRPSSTWRDVMMRGINYDAKEIMGCEDIWIARHEEFMRMIDRVTPDVAAEIASLKQKYQGQFATLPKELKKELKTDEDLQIAVATVRYNNFDLDEYLYNVCLVLDRKYGLSGWDMFKDKRHYL